MMSSVDSGGLCRSRVTVTDRVRRTEAAAAAATAARAQRLGPGAATCSRRGPPARRRSVASRLAAAAWDRVASRVRVSLRL